MARAVALFLFPIGAVLAVLGCDQLALGPKTADSAPPPATAAPAPPDLRPFVGDTYAVFSTRPDMARFNPQGLGLADADRARLEAALAEPAPAFIAQGGGAEALVFVGCAQDGCAAGRAVLAIELETRAVFAGVAGPEGAEALAPNARLEALLGLTSPSRAWEDLPLSPPPVTAPQPQGARALDRANGLP